MRSSFFAITLSLLLCAPVAAYEPFRIEITDGNNDWPVPLVELKTTHGVRLVSDNAGIIACDVPELMGVETFFHVEGHGYSVQQDGFGYRGVRLTPQPGETVKVVVTRELPAKRIGRLTGAGLFAESQKFGVAQDWQEQGIVGCDSVLMTQHNGRLFWVWGDTTLARYPLGIFDSLGATTPPRPLQEFNPPLKMRFDYYRDSRQRPRGICKMPGAGPTWMSGLVSLSDAQGVQHLVSTYTKIQPPLSAYETGLCVWDEQQRRFVQQQVLWTKSSDQPKPSVMPHGHPYRWRDNAGIEWLLCGDPFPHLKVRATFEAWSDPSAWQPLTPQQRVSVKGSNEFIEPHRGSVAWNEYRQKWVTIFTQMGGTTSLLGELWYAEAGQPTGPWKDAIHVVTHQNYTFYNPRIHPELTPSGSPILLFEGTYTKEFANHAEATPRYNYNQILYRLDLDDLPELD